MGLVETLTWWQVLMLTFVLFGAGCAAFACLLLRYKARFDGDRQRFEQDNRRQRDRLHSVASEEQYGPGRDGITRLPVSHDGPWRSPLVRGPEDGIVRADLAAFAGLLLSMALVGAAIWNASGW